MVPDTVVPPKNFQLLMVWKHMHSAETVLWILIISQGSDRLYDTLAMLSSNSERNSQLGIQSQE